jgi:pyruvate,orthophosphate dikinase
MNTFLNVGLNEDIVEGLIRKTENPWFAWDNYRRFLQSWGMSYGMERDVFDAIMGSHKMKHGVGRKGEFTPSQMHHLALAYKEALHRQGVILTDDPYEQLFQAIRQVICSWNSETAMTYREIMGISDDWGTAVIVQRMIYGNLHAEAGSGVVFTHNPQTSTDKVVLWGDYTAGNQGEDVVSGLVRTDSISLEQTAALNREQDNPLETALPEVYEALREIAKTLIYEEGWSAQEIEFTFEGPSRDELYILQSRDMEVRHAKRYARFVPSNSLKGAILTKGVGVGGGAISGRIVFSLEDIQSFRAKEPDTPVILVRFDTVPDDLREISAADGLLTSRGGATSHASIVAQQLKKTCVVGCSKLIVHEKQGYGIINGETIQCGDFLSIDGQNGFVYKGRHDTILKEGGISS